MSQCQIIQCFILLQLKFLFTYQINSLQQICKMLTTPIKALSLSGSKINSKETSPIKDPQINHAAAKFSLLNNSYQIEYDLSNMLIVEDSDKFPKKKNGKVDNFTIMARLRHLENVASLNNADLEKNQREKSKKTLLTKNMPRSRKLSVKINNSLEQSYQKIYESYLKSNESFIFEENLKCSKQSESEASGIGQEILEKELNFSKELKGYKKIINYTQEKLKQRKYFLKMSSSSQKKFQSLQEIRSMEKDKELFRDYAELANQSKKVNSLQKQRKKGQMQISPEKIVHKNMNRIFRRSQQAKKKEIEGLKEEERFSRIIKKQNQFLSKCTNEKTNTNQNQNKNLQIVKSKFASIILEMSRARRPNSHHERRNAPNF